MDKNDVEVESGQDRNTSNSSEETRDEFVDDETMVDASGIEDVKTSTPTREPRGKKRFKNSARLKSCDCTAVEQTQVYKLTLLIKKETSPMFCLTL